MADGMEGEAVASLDGLTTLQYARTPALDALRGCGAVRLLHTTPVGMKPGSEVAIVSLLGYDARRVAQSRAPFEAAGAGYVPKSGELLMRCNLVEIGDDGMISPPLSHDEPRQAIERLNRECTDRRVRFIEGQGSHHLLAIEGGSADIICTPAHEALGRPASDCLARAAGVASSTYTALTPMETAMLVNKLALTHHVWPWSPGFPPEMKPLGIDGAVITAVNLVRGIARYAGLEIIEVPGATGEPDTNYSGKAMAALQGIADHDFVMLHIEGSDTASHARDIGAKIRAIEMIDRLVIAPIVSSLREAPYRVELTVTADHPTSVLTGLHLPHPVTAVIACLGLKS